MKLILPDLRVVTVEEGPIAVYLTESDKENIAKMTPGSRLFAVADAKVSPTEFDEFADRAILAAGALGK